MEKLPRAVVRKSLLQSIGSVLEQERLCQNLDLRDVSQGTRIPIYVLARIERGKAAYVWECYNLAAFYGRRFKVELI